MKMGAIKVDANFTNNMIRERSFSEKQTCKANRLFRGISDLDPSENFKNDRNTNHIDEKEQYIYTRPIEDDEDDEEEEEDDDGTVKKRILVALGVICCIAILALIGFGVFWYLKFWKDSSISKLSPVEKVQKKCKEYTDLACSFKASSDKGPIQIVSGDRVPRGMLPHQAYLQFQLIDDDRHSAVCGGSLINERFILTAAHCVENVSLTGMKVLLGSLNRHNSNLTLWKKIKKFHIHPNYTGRSISDIGLLELVENVKFNSDVRPICLNTKLEEHYDLVITSGWGLTESGGPSDYLRMVESRIDGKEVVENCRLYLENKYPFEFELANKTLICAAHVRQGIDHGDSGGPLQVKLKSSCENTWEQIGITSSAGTIKGEKEYNGIHLTWQLFVKVEYYIPWIASLVWPD